MCNFYKIYKLLLVTFTDNSILKIKLSCEKCFIYKKIKYEDYEYDETENFSSSRINKNIEKTQNEIIKVYTEPIPIYIDYYINNQYEEKYEKIILQELKYNLLEDKKIKNIYKIEERELCHD